MSGPVWNSLRSIERSLLAEARLVAHCAAQWLARTARAYVAPKEDDSHTNLGWDQALDGLTTHPLPDGSLLGLRIADLTLVLRDSQGSDAAFALAGQKDADVREWLGAQMRAKGLGPDALDKPAPYDIPASPIATGGRYPQASLEPALGELSRWFGNASRALDGIREDLVAHGLRAPAVRCWPHHFDLDTLIYLDRKGADETSTMGVGLSPGDEYYDAPYFYVSLYPAPDVAALPALAAGPWHSRDFTAAILTADRILAAKDQQAAAVAFLSSATDIAIMELCGQSAEQRPKPPAVA